MFAPSKIKVGARAVALALALATSSFSAHAVLERTGPVSVDPSVGGFPTWYQDTTGLALEFCGPMNASEVAGGWCLLLPPVAAPETFPNNFFIEHFYFAGTAVLSHQGGIRSRLVMAQEASFANGSVVRPGDQTTFARIRVVLTPVPVTGTYRFIHPFGEETRQGVAGDKIFFTNDVGLGCGLNFDCALNGRIGPFLLPSDVPGGAEMPALTATNQTPDTNPAHFNGAVVTPGTAVTPYPDTGKAYIADPARIGPVTGSPLPNFIDSTGASRNHNIFRIEGPPGSALGGLDALGNSIDWIETTDMALMGRIYDGVIPGRVDVERASYTRTATAQKLDVFANGFPTTQGRLPASPRPVGVAPSLTFFDQTCSGTVDPVTGAILPPFGAPVGAVETPMKASGSMQWAQTLPGVIPTAVCVKNANATNAAGAIVPIYTPHLVTDEVTVTPAFYDPTLATMTVGAGSSDVVLLPTLTLAYGGYLGDLVGGQIVVPNMAAPPANIVVDSSALGSTKYQVSTGFATGVVAGIPLAANDSFTFPMTTVLPLTQYNLPILANDSNVAGGTVAISAAPTLGSAAVNLDGSVTYTPNLNAAGADSFTYTVTVGTQVSNIGTVAINLTPVNVAPTANNDAVNAIAAKARLIKVLANDTDPNGAADIVAAVNVSQPAGGATTTVAGGIVTFTAPAAGTYSFTYQAMDAGGLISANTATVTVTVAASESLAYTKNQYTVAQQRLTVAGTVSPFAEQTVAVETVQTDPLTGAVTGTTPAGTAVVGTNGTWTLDVVGVALPANTTSVKSTTSNGTVLATGLQLK